MTFSELKEQISHTRRYHRISTPMERAILHIANGSTWREAAQRHGVTESGIYRAFARIRGCIGKQKHAPTTERYTDD